MSGILCFQRILMSANSTQNAFYATYAINGWTFHLMITSRLCKSGSNTVRRVRKQRHPPLPCRKHCFRFIHFFNVNTCNFFLLLYISDTQRQLKCLLYCTRLQMKLTNLWSLLPFIVFHSRHLTPQVLLLQNNAVSPPSSLFNLVSFPAIHSPLFMTWTQPTLLLLMNLADATRNREQLPCELIDLLEKLNLIVSFVLSARNGYNSVKTALTALTLGFNTVESVWQDSESSLFFFLS